VQTRKFRPKIHAHTSAIKSVCVSPDGAYIATCSEKGTTIKLFSLQSGETIKKYRVGLLKSEISDLSFSRRSEYLVCVSGQKKAQIFGVTKNLILKEGKSTENT